MLRFATAIFVFVSGFTIMVLEVIGARYLAADFGDAFSVWISQIGVILIALALGYAIGGSLAYRFHRVWCLSIPVALAGISIFFIPKYTPPLFQAIVMRHPLGQPIPQLWVRLDPVLGSGSVFFLPCFALAVVSPYMVRVMAGRLERIGTISGLIYAASTVGSIAGVFISGYFLIPNYGVKAIFRATGVVTFALALLGLAMDKWLIPRQPVSGNKENP